MVFFSSCKKDEPISSNSISQGSESFPPGWQSFTSSVLSPTGIAIDNTDNIWFYNFHQLNKMSGGTITDFSAAVTSNLVSSAIISSLAFDNSNSLWIAIKNQYDDSSFVGLMKYDGTSYQTFNMLNSGIHSNKVVNVAIDPMDVKWLGTQQSCKI